MRHEQRHRRTLAHRTVQGDRIVNVVHGIRARDHFARNLDTIEEAIHAEVSIVGIDPPVGLIALAEGAFTGFTDEIFDLPHAQLRTRSFPSRRTRVAI
ncbi:hypothetical protein [Streptomyces sp. NPDC002540]